MFSWRVVPPNPVAGMKPEADTMSRAETRLALVRVDADGGGGGDEVLAARTLAKACDSEWSRGRGSARETRDAVDGGEEVQHELSALQDRRP